MTTQQFHADETTPPILVAALKHWLPDLSWSKIRRLMSARQITVGGTLCIDESRKLRSGDLVAVHEHSQQLPPQADAVKVHYVDRDIVVVEKPPRMLCERHRRERSWPRSKRMQQPTLEEVMPDLLYRDDRKHRPPVLGVHRIDRDTSGLLIWARTEAAQAALIAQFAEHTIVRRYRAFVAGKPKPQTVRSRLIRDRGDGLRGSTDSTERGKEAVTHIEPLQTWRSSKPQGEGSKHGGASGEITEVLCQLETGRTHQIRIHLAELGHPVCGDSVYRGKFGEPPIEDSSQARRVALHACELGFSHPTSGEAMHFESPWPKDIKSWQERSLVG